MYEEIDNDRKVATTLLPVIRLTLSDCVCNADFLSYCFTLKDDNFNL